MLVIPHLKKIAFMALSAGCLAVAAEPAGAPLLVHFDFEATDAHSVWKETPPKGEKPLVLVLDADNPHSGRTALKLQANADGQGARFVFTGISLPADRPQRVRVRAYARTAGLAAGEAELNMLERDQTKVLGWCGDKEVLIPIDAAGEWKAFTADVVIRPEARVLTFFIRIRNPEPGKTVWIDDLSIEFIEDVSK